MAGLLLYSIVNGSIVEGFLHGVFHAADRILDLALGLISLAFALQLGVAGRLAGGLLYLTLSLIEAAFDTVLFITAVPHVRVDSRRQRVSGESRSKQIGSRACGMHAVQRVIRHSDSLVLYRRETVAILRKLSILLGAGRAALRIGRAGAFA